MFPADGCKSEFPYSGDVNRHMQGVHENVKFNCYKCKFEGNSKISLKAHMKNVHTVATFDCTVGGCGRKFARKANLARHRHVNCEKCEFETSYKETLKAHINTIHEVKPLLKCDECDYMSQYSNLIKRHRESVHEKKRWNCTQCEYTSSSSDTTKRHTKIRHEGFVYLSRLRFFFNMAIFFKHPFKSKPPRSPISVQCL